MSNLIDLVMGSLPSKIDEQIAQAAYYRQLEDDHRKQVRIREMELADKKDALDKLRQSELLANTYGAKALASSLGAMKSAQAPQETSDNIKSNMPAETSSFSINEDKLLDNIKFNMPAETSSLESPVLNNFRAGLSNKLERDLITGDDPSENEIQPVNSFREAILPQREQLAASQEYNNLLEQHIAALNTPEKVEAANQFLTNDPNIQDGLKKLMSNDLRDHATQQHIDEFNYLKNLNPQTPNEQYAVTKRMSDLRDEIQATALNNKTAAFKFATSFADKLITHGNMETAQQYMDMASDIQGFPHLKLADGGQSIETQLTGNQILNSDIAKRLPKLLADMVASGDPEKEYHVTLPNRGNNAAIKVMPVEKKDKELKGSSDLQDFILLHGRKPNDAQEFFNFKKSSSAAKRKGDEGIDDTSVEAAANYLIKTGDRSIISGFGDKAVSFKTAVLKKAHEMTGNKDLAEVIIKAKRENLASDSEVRTQAKRFVSLEAFSAQALNNMKSIEDFLPGLKNSKTDKSINNINVSNDAISRLGIKTADQFILYLKTKIKGDPKEQAYYNQIYETAVEYAKVVSGSTTGAALTDTSRKEILTLLSSADKPDTVKRVLKTWRQNIKNAREGHADVLNSAIEGTLSKDKSDFSDVEKSSDLSELRQFVNK